MQNFVNNTCNLINSTEYESNIVVKSSPGKLYVLDGYNSNDTGQFIQFHDAASLPANSSVPIFFIEIPKKGTFSCSWNFGLQFSTGIVVCNSSTGPTLTVGGDDCWFLAQYK